jgi:hypothetical protein
VRYPWHPWCGRLVGIEETIEKRTQSFFRCRIEEAAHGRALEIPHWMFETACETIELTAEPGVNCAALRQLRSILRSASLYDRSGGEAQHLQSEGGADAKNPEPAAICTIGIVSPAIEERLLGGTTPGDAAKDDTANRTTAPPALGQKLPRRGGRP